MLSDRHSGFAHITAKSMIPELNSAGRFIEQCSSGMRFRNETARTLVVSFRTGVRFTIPPYNRNLGCPNSLVVEVEYSSTTTVKTDVDDQYSVGRALPDISTSVWSTATGCSRGKDAVPIVSYGGNQVSRVMYTFDIDDIMVAGGSVYSHELDILITVASTHNILPPPHPYTRMGSCAEVHRQVEREAGEDGSLFCIRIVDRHRVFGGRYVNFSGWVSYIKAEFQPDDEIRDGVYVTLSQSSNNVRANVKRSTALYTFAEAAEKLPLYMSYEEALTLGNPQEVRKRELDEQKHQFERERNQFNEEAHRRKVELAEREAQYEHSRREHERDLLQRKESLERQQAEHAEREMHFKRYETEAKTEQIIIRNRLDERSDSRKMLLEALKFIPALLGAVVTVIAVVAKFKESK